MRSVLRFAFALVLLTIIATSLDQTNAAEPGELWSFENKLSDNTRLVGNAEISETVPTKARFPQADLHSASLQMSGGAHVEITDSKMFRFGNQDPITLETWFRVDRESGTHIYLIGKGRTFSKGKRLENQDFALRVSLQNGALKPSFLFATQADDSRLEYHRWTANQGVSADGQWHHVAISYVFGTPSSLKCFLDGNSSTGVWDMGGATTRPPVQSQEPIWLGSSRGGDPGSSLNGALHGTRICKSTISSKQLRNRGFTVETPPSWPSNYSPNHTLVTLHEGVGNHTKIPSISRTADLEFGIPFPALHRLPINYESGGLRKLWKGPSLMRMFVETNSEGGEHELLLRTQGLARIWHNNQVVAQTKVKRFNLNAHQPWVKYERDMPWLRVPPAGEQEVRAKVNLPPGRSKLIVEIIVGSQKTRVEPGETVLAIRKDDELFSLVQPADSVHRVALTDAEVLPYLDQLETQLISIDDSHLITTSKTQSSNWDAKHLAARESITNQRIPQEPSDISTELDHLIRLSVSSKMASKISTNAESFERKALEDKQFARRLYLDLWGTPPSLPEWEHWQRTGGSRQELVNSLLSEEFEASRNWADHWTGYWQDVLAENPNILKPTLNNSGPFRLYLNDALRLNKPLDRIVTELINLGGDQLAGGPAGFGIATENDVPKAEKAHILAAAFLAVDMKCARCHDAPYHPWKQRDLFQLAAMLEGKAIKVPASSSVPAAFFEGSDHDSPIKVTLKPGQQVQPAWPEALSKLLPEEEIEATSAISSRERLAHLITSPQNKRFAEVIVNRVWERLFGWGFRASADDWFETSVRHPQVMRLLADDFAFNGYDLKRLVRVIVCSETYQSRAIENVSTDPMAYAAPWRRRLTAEQIVDGMHHVAGVRMATENITFDSEATQQLKNFLNLGKARRAWQLTSLANERDRPSLALPQAATIVECLEAFGWRSSRQSPKTYREDEPNLVQPGVLSNGALAGRITRLTDQSFLTELAIDASSPDEFCEDLFQAILTRSPSTKELQVFSQELNLGFENRLVDSPSKIEHPPENRGFVTWTNHFTVEANKLSQLRTREAEAGPVATSRLEPAWRKRAEDAAWALLNAPEFILTP